MDPANESARRQAMLHARGFYATRRTPNGPVIIRERAEGRAVPTAYWIGRTITTIGGVDITDRTDEEIYYSLISQLPSSSSSASAEPTYLELGFKARQRTDQTRETERKAKVNRHSIVNNAKLLSLTHHSTSIGETTQ
jgi:hypothetical protein